MSENGEIYTAGKNFTLPPAVTGWTNSTSGQLPKCCVVGDILLHIEKMEKKEMIAKKKVDKVQIVCFSCQYFVCKVDTRD